MAQMEEPRASFGRCLQMTMTLDGITIQYEEDSDTNNYNYMGW